ncbi:alpha/beta hydrolase [Fusobacterium sp. PH5-44]|uniref:alpha/beta hydrolase n=1 Tax=unclassified Fusobacterium TaxID=2648384 RepID=UPI003D1A96F3
MKLNKKSIENLKLNLVLLFIFFLLNNLAFSSEQTVNSESTNYNYKIEEMSIATDNGKKIYGQLYLPDHLDKKIPIVISAHGYGGTHKNNKDYAEALARQGIAVYNFDFCGGSLDSKSDGKTTEMSVLTEVNDLKNVLSYLQKLDYVETNSIFLLGISQGGMVSSIIASEKLDEIAGMILIYPAFVIPDDVKKKYDSIDKIPETTEWMGMQLGKVYFADMLDYNIYEKIPFYDKNVLIIHGDKDELVNISYSQKAQEVYPNSELKIINGAGHGFNENDKKIVIEYMIDYINKNLGN